VVAFTDLSQVNALYLEADSIDRGIDNLEHDGRITSMMIAPPPLPVPPPPEPLTPAQEVAQHPVQEPGATGATTPPAPPPLPTRWVVNIDTSGLTYPAQMVQAIIQQLRARRTAIDAELTKLGVTGTPGATGVAAAAARPTRR
jgi:hypothetical protein